MDISRTVSSHGESSEETRIIDTEPHAPFSDEEFNIALKVLKNLSLVQYADVYESPEFRPLRQILQVFFDRQRAKMFNGSNPENESARKMRKKQLANETNKKRLEDIEFLKKTKLRASRMQKLDELVHRDDETISFSRILDGIADDGVHTSSGPTSTEFSILGPEVKAEDSDTKTVHAGQNESSSLHGTRGCYICKCRFQVLHHFYDSLCEQCSGLNWSKRMQMCDMSGRICLVTGGRVKIGFQCCLKLLRCGSVVIATSRFPADCALRFSAQNDFHEWKDRLHIFGIDLRDIPAIELLCTFLQNSFPWIDAIINNVSVVISVHQLIFL